MSEVLYRKWRPQVLADVAGQEHVTRTLRNALATHRVAHAYLFCGPRGTGKTSTGRILAKAINCLTDGAGEPCNACAMCESITEGRSLDVVEIDAASNRGIDEIRELRERVNFAPNQARFKVYIIDEVHMLTEPAFNALLKTLEEPPAHAVFILATTEVHDIPATILSRCQRFDFRRIPQSAVVARLEHVCQHEKIDIEPAGLALIARGATGSLRDAENLMQQLVTFYGDSITAAQVASMLGITGDARIRELAKHIFGRDVSAGLTTINSVSADGLDLRQFGRELVEYLRTMLLVKAGAEGATDLPAESLAQIRGMVSSLAMNAIVRAIKLFGQIDPDLSRGADEQATLPLELALVEYSLEERAPAAQAAPVKEAPAKPVERRPKAVETETVVAPGPRVEVAAPAPAPEPVASQLETSSAPAKSPLESIDRLSALWNQVVEASKGADKKGTVAALLRGCKPQAVEDSTMVLGCSSTFHKDKVENPEILKVVEEAVSRILGTPHRVRCVLAPERKTVPRPVKESPLVKEALRMGARIVTEGE
ncbi:MAG: DNA polymerase III subunit gamma/tau [Chloroflexi bacterium]|nr:DNA polymerase III subunit gamma/tau [Chloroflexota bacterium]